MTTATLITTTTKENQLHPQLSFDVHPHPNAVREDNPDGYLTAALKIGGSFFITQDMHPGEELTVTVANADGQVVAQGVAEIGGVGFTPIKDAGRTIGMERQHKAKLKG